MKNRAKCKLCEEVIESHFLEDNVSCKCGEISISGGELKNWCAAKNWENFLRIDDEGNEIVPKVIIKPLPDSLSNQNTGDVKPLYIEKPTKEEMVEMLDKMIKSIEDLPQQAMTLPVNQYDLLSFMLLISSILKEK